MRVLIPTYPKDVHALEVALALEDRGHEAVVWHGSDFPAVQSASIDLRGTEAAWEIAGLGLEGGRPPFEVVWFRRPTPPVVPSTLHPSDLPVARRECQDFLVGLYHLVDWAAPDAFWVNSLASRPRSERKALQLAEAARAGLATPPTLMSNDPERIRRFLGEFQGRAIYKPFFPVQWESGDDVAVLLTSEVTAEDLPEDETLRLSPGIFQARVDKAHELRVTVMGAHLACARLLSQESDSTRIDWRAGAAGLRVEPDRLPEAVERACLRLMKSLGLVFGALDLIVTPEGEHVFLEVNPSGQFLWVEEANSEIPLLAPFVDFLLSRDPDFRWQPKDGAIRHEDYQRRALELIDADGARHVDPEEPFVDREK